MVDYTSVTRMLNVAPMIGSVTNITSAQLAQFAEDGEAEVNAFLAQTYTVPVTHGPPMLAAIATDLALYRVFAQRIFTQERLKDSGWPERFKEAREMLATLAKGEQTLVDSAGNVIAARTDLAEVWSNTKEYHPTFSELPPETSTIDDDKIDDLEDDRDLSNTKDITI